MTDSGRARRVFLNAHHPRRWGGCWQVYFLDFPPPAPDLSLPTAAPGPLCAQVEGGRPPDRRPGARSKPSRRRPCVPEGKVARKTRNATSGGGGWWVFKQIGAFPTKNRPTYKAPAPPSYHPTYKAPATPSLRLSDLRHIPRCFGRGDHQVCWATDWGGLGVQQSLVPQQSGSRGNPRNGCVHRGGFRCGGG